MTNSEPSSSPAAQAKKKVLIVDDDKNTLAVIQASLENADFQVFTASNAKHGVMMARQILPDLLVVNMKMPAGGGEVVLDGIRQINFAKR